MLVGVDETRSVSGQLTHSDLLYNSLVCFLSFLGLHQKHMKVPRLGVETKLQLLTYTVATAMWHPSRVCCLHHSSWQCWILSPLREARDQTRVLLHTSQILYG